ncbi:MAG: calcium-binding protein [Leptolyngbyaceae bacterium]|nr:calcium-binding protein [Leptolyngbyaceae bacterium]
MAVFTGTNGPDSLDVIALAPDPDAGHELRGLEGDDNLLGGDGSDRLQGGEGDDFLFGKDGNDQLDGGPGADEMFGGNGNDAYTVDHVNDFIFDSDGVGRINAYVSYTTSEGLSLFLRAPGIVGTGTNGNNFIASSAPNTTLQGLGGSDLLKGSDGSRVEGGDGNDILEITGSGNGTLIGGAGDDTYNILIAPADLRIDEREGGIDTIFTTIDNFSLENMPGITYVSGRFIENLTLAAPGASQGQVNGPITASGNSLDNQIVGNRQDNVLSGLNGNDTIFGSFGNDIIDGGNHDDHLYGNEGDDELIAGSGNDILEGGEGNDTYRIDSGDIIIEPLGAGSADIVFVSGSFATNAEVETIHVTTTSSVTITLSNTTGTEIYLAAGSTGQDVLTGGDGNDVLRGGANIDTLAGGLGADTFVFGGTGLSATGATSTSIRQDTIADFQATTDIIRLDATSFTALTSFVGGDLSGTDGSGTPGFALFNGVGSINTVNALVVYDTTTGDLLYNPNGSGFGTGGGGVFANLSGIPSLSTTDFEVVNTVTT